MRQNIDTLQQSEIGDGRDDEVNRNNQDQQENPSAEQYYGNDGEVTIDGGTDHLP